MPCHPDSLAMAYALKLGRQGRAADRPDRPEDPDRRRPQHDRLRAGRRGARRRLQAVRDQPLAGVGREQPARPALLPAAGRGARRRSATRTSSASSSCSSSTRYSFDVRSVKKTCVHIVHPDGRLIPFDTYNLFYRDDLERRGWRRCGRLRALHLLATETQSTLSTNLQPQRHKYTEGMRLRFTPTSSAWQTRVLFAERVCQVVREHRPEMREPNTFRGSLISGLCSLTSRRLRRRPNTSAPRRLCVLCVSVAKVPRHALAKSTRSTRGRPRMPTGLRRARAQAEGSASWRRADYSGRPMRYSYTDLAKMIDHSLLHPTMTDRELAARTAGWPRNTRSPRCASNPTQ